MKTNTIVRDKGKAERSFEVLMRVDNKPFLCYFISIESKKEKRINYEKKETDCK